jgi:PAP2 superfamily
MMSHETAIQWLLLALVALTDWAWMATVGFRIDSEYFQGLGCIFLLMLISLFYFYTGRDQRIMALAQFGAQLFSLYGVMILLIYLAVTTNAPLADDAFNAFDKSLGLDWVAWTQWVRAHPILRWGLFIAYSSLPFQVFFCYIYNAHTRANWRNSELWWVTFVSLLVTIVISAMVPATNPYVYYGLQGADYFLHMQHFLGLRDGTIHVMQHVNDEGLIQLPSFHTILAIVLTYHLRHNRWFFATAVVLNTALILSCPSEGSHYFVDLIAGAVVAAATIWGVRRLGRHFAWGLQPEIVVQPVFMPQIIVKVSR